MLDLDESRELYIIVR